MATAGSNGDRRGSSAKGQGRLVEQTQLTIMGLKLAAFDRETAFVCCSALAAWIPPVE
jgi:hypothetical protein